MMKIDENSTLAHINQVLNGRAHIAGGALRSYIEGETPRDIDVFFTEQSEELYSDVLKDITKMIGAQVLIHNRFMSYVSTDFLLTDGYTPLSLIKPIELGARKLYGNPDELLKGFDFNVCACVLLPDNTLYFGSDEAEAEVVHSIHSRVFRLQEGIQKCTRTERRILKYIGKGYTFKED